MAILGAQLVFSMVVFSFLQKLSCFYSFGRWLLAGRVVRYLHPTDEDLKVAAGIPTGNAKSKGQKGDLRRRNVNNKPEPFTIPRNTPIELETAKVEAFDLIALNYYEEYLWVMDFTLSATAVYILTEIYNSLGHRNEMNISFLWCLLAIAFCLRVLISQCTHYFKAEDGGERILIFTFGFFCLVLAMGILAVDENTLEFGLQEGYENFSASAMIFLENQGINSEGPVSFLSFKIILAFICAIIGGLLTFPGIRMSKLYLDSLKYSKESPFKQLLLHINFILPGIILLLWVKPVARDILCGKNWRVTTSLFSESIFDSFRIFMFIVLIFLRLVLLPTHIQSHLNLAYEKVVNLRKESGRISNVELQKMVASVFYFVGVVTLQYLVPVIILFFLACLYKTLGNFSWAAMFGEPAEDFVHSLASVPSVVNKTVANNGTEAENIVDKVMQFSLAFSNLREVFTPLWYRGVISFLAWWTCAAWTASMAFGLYYHSNLS